MRKEYQSLCKSPVDCVKAHPLESNILVSSALMLDVLVAVWRDPCC